MAPVPPGCAARPDAASSVAPVLTQYERSLRPCLGTSIATRRRGLFRKTLLGAVVVAPLAGLAAVDRLEFLEAPAGAYRDTGQRALRKVDRHLRLVAEPLVEAVQEGAAAGEDDPAVHDVGGELGRRLVERRLDRLDDLADRPVERAADLLG